MTSHELRQLFETSVSRIRELEMKYRSGGHMTRADCVELQTCNARLHLTGRELWLLSGCPDGDEWELFRLPHVNQPLPRCYQPLDLTDRNATVEVH